MQKLDILKPGNDTKKTKQAVRIPAAILPASLELHASFAHQQSIIPSTRPLQTCSWLSSSTASYIINFSLISLIFFNNRASCEP